MEETQYCEETVELWVRSFKFSNLRELEDEIDDTRGAISNERLWLKGAETEEQEMCHLQNIADLEEYCERLEASARLMIA